MEQQAYNGATMIRLLVADDAPFIREIVRSVAERKGFVLIGEAIDGEDAVDQALRLRPDVILMDIIMPKKSGIEATAQIMSQLPETKIIAFSTADQEVMVMRALEAGCCSYLTKPFKSEELVEAIQSAFGIGGTARKT
jgi:two-component system, chemotaxis family, chemotaxis protein CheY